MRVGSITRRLTSAALTGAVAVALLVGSSAPAGAITPQNQRYVRAIYGSILDRADVNVDQTGIDFWANRLENQSRFDVVRTIMFSTSEYFQNVLAVDYNLYLNRSADTGGETFYVNAWRSGNARHEDVVDALVGSPEYYANHGSTPSSFVQAAYFDILGREADPGGLQFFTNLAQQPNGRAQTAQFLITSHENHTYEVNYKYRNFLNRNPDPGAFTYWVNALDTGLRFELFDVYLTTSAEYYAIHS